jgi:hypothetical protein
MVEVEDRLVVEWPESEGQPPAPGKQWALSEQLLMVDGQLGAANLERGPERANPEGTVDTPNPPLDRR